MNSSRACPSEPSQHFISHLRIILLLHTTTQWQILKCLQMHHHFIRTLHLDYIWIYPLNCNDKILLCHYHISASTCTCLVMLDIELPSIHDPLLTCLVIPPTGHSISHCLGVGGGYWFCSLWSQWLALLVLQAMVSVLRMWVIV